MMVQHHEKYEEIHGEDKIVMMEFAEHQELHRRLREEGTCTIPPTELHKISYAAYMRTEKGQKTKKGVQRKAGERRRERTKTKRFSKNIGPIFTLITRIELNTNNESVKVYSYFNSRKKNNLIYIDILSSESARTDSN